MHVHLHRHVQALRPLELEFLVYEDPQRAKLGFLNCPQALPNYNVPVVS